MRNRNGLIIIIVVILTICALIIIKRPDIINKIWLWLIGFAGPIIGFAKKGFESIAQFLNPSNITSGNNKLSNNQLPDEKEVNNIISKEKDYLNEIETLNQQVTYLEYQLRKLKEKDSKTDNFIGTTLTLLRYFDDGETTLGLLFFDQQFYCYVLEDTYNDPKIINQTRIPKGTYAIDFDIIDNKLNKKFKRTRDWFTHHLEIKNVKHFSNVYIICGNNSDDSEGSLLVSGNLTLTDKKKILNNSKETYKKLYADISKNLSSGSDIRIKIYDENWFEKNFKI